MKVNLECILFERRKTILQLNLSKYVVGKKINKKKRDITFEELSNVYNNIKINK